MLETQCLLLTTIQNTYGFIDRFSKNPLLNIVPPYRPSAEDNRNIPKIRSKNAVKPHQ